MPLSRLLILVSILTCVGLSGAYAQHVILNEIMYAPTAPEPEWIELQNPDSAARVESHLAIRVGSKVLSLPTITLPPEGYIVLVKDSSALRQARDASFPILQCALPALRNTGDTVSLLDGSSLIEAAAYSPSWGGKSGRSLERRAPWLDPSKQSSWRESSDSLGATPGRRNSVEIYHRDLYLRMVTWQFDQDSLILSASITNVGSDTIADGVLKIDGYASSSARLPALAMDSSATVQSRVGGISSDSIDLAIIIDVPGDEQQSNDTVMLTIPPGLHGGSIVLNEIQSVPIAPEPEWIELFNPTDRMQSLSECSVRVNKNLIRLPDLSLGSAEYLAITSDDSSLAVIRNADRGRLIRCALPTLSNTGGSIALLDARGRLIDSVRYAGTTIGHSIERINPYRPAPTPEFWRTSTDTTGATLLRMNSNRIKDRDGAIRIISVAADTARITVANAGLDTIDRAILVIEREDEKISQDTLTAIPPYDSIIYSKRIGVAKPLGVSQIRAITMIEDDEFSDNDTSTVLDEDPIPIGAVLINEVMYEPSVGSCEWVELLNTTDSVVSLRDCEVLGGSSENLSTYSIPSGLIAPQSYGVISADASIFNAFPDLNAQHSVLVLRRSSLSLPNDSGTVVLRSADGAVIDSLTYRASWQNKYAGDLHGRSLERRSTTRPTNDSANWTSSSDIDGATPLRPNSTSSIVASTQSEISVDISPKPLRRDAGTPAIIKINSSAQEGLVRIRIYGAGGRSVRTLADGRLWSGAGSLAFDGKDDDGRTLAPGLYTLLVQITDVSGNTSAKRSGLVIAP